MILFGIVSSTSGIGSPVKNKSSRRYCSNTSARSRRNGARRMVMHDIHDQHLLSAVFSALSSISACAVPAIQ